MASPPPHRDLWYMSCVSPPPLPTPIAAAPAAGKVVEMFKISLLHSVTQIICCPARQYSSQNLLVNGCVADLAIGRKKTQRYTM